MIVLLDRDGVVNVEIDGYVTVPKQIELIAGSGPAIARLNRAGIKTALVTNQSAVGRGLIDENTLERIHSRLAELLAAEDAHLDIVVYCSDLPWAPTARRKPNPGMIWEAARMLDAFPPNAVMIGDDLRDLVAASRAGCRRILVRTGKGADIERAGLPRHVQPVLVRDNLAAAVDDLLEIER
tara:strand:- start:371 stop:916 length:546 start_codon:yes stop_codon:yes gene_type:complete